MERAPHPASRASFISFFFTKHVYCKKRLCLEVESPLEQIELEGNVRNFLFLTIFTNSHSKYNNNKIYIRVECSDYKYLVWVVRKLVNTNPELKVNRGNNFSCIKVLSIAYFLCSLNELILKTEGQKI